MMHRVLAPIALAAAVLALSGGASTAQQAVSVTVTASRAGTVSEGCPPQSPTLSVSPQFVLTRTGDVTDGLAVSVSWSGELASRIAVSPDVVEFAAGSTTATITTGFASVPVPTGALTIAVVPGAGYQPGDPASADATFTVIAPSCAAQPPTTPPEPPTPIGATPIFTG
jgi:hypothetical protein